MCHSLVTRDRLESGCSLQKGVVGQVMYFDNSPMGSRELCLEDATVFPNCIDVNLSPSDRVEPVMYHISTRLPRYIKLDIASDGTITPSIPPLPHQNPPVVGQDIPQNGAIVWLTAAEADPNKPDRDIEIYPLDPLGSPKPTSCVGGSLPNCPCDSAAASFATAQACDANYDPATNPGGWLRSYGIAAYAIGYVNGKPRHLLRSVIAIQ